MEIKCQLDATEVFIADLIARSTCFGNHYAHHQELKSIIQWLLSVIFHAVVFKLLVWCGAEGYVSGLQDAADLIACSTCFGHHYAHHQERKSIIQWLLPVVFRAWFSSCWSGVELRVMCPVCRKHVERTIRSAIKTSVASSWHFISTYYSLLFGS